MKRFSSLKPRLRVGASVAMMGAVIYAGSLFFVTGAEANAEKEAKSEKKADKQAAKKKLTGAELYAINCNRCHNERYPTEFTAAQWKTIMLEMRVRANLPAAQAKAILKYLQEDSGTP
jgi:hypothetical protein